MGINYIVLINVVLNPCGIVTVLYLSYLFQSWYMRKAFAGEDAAVGERLVYAFAIEVTGRSCGIAYFISYVAIVLGGKAPHFPPIDKQDWLLAVAAATIAFAIVETFVALVQERADRFNLVLFLLRALVSTTTVWLIVSGMISREETGWQYYAWIAGLSVLGLLQWELNAALARRITSFAMAEMLVPVSVAVSLALTIAGDAKHGLLAAAIGACAGTIMVASWFSPDAPLARGLVTVSSPLLYALVLCGRYYADAPLLLCAFLVAAPLGGWIAELPPIKRLRPWQSGVIRLLFVAVLTGAAVAIANAPKDSGEE